MKLVELFIDENDEISLELPTYLTDQYEFWMYPEKLAEAFDKKFNRKDDNPIVKRGLNQYTLDWMRSNSNTPTAYYFEDLPLNPQQLSKLEGLTGEHTYIHTPKHKERISALAKSMIDNGFNRNSPILIHVTKQGPKIVEGNHRVHAAVEAGLNVIPVEWRWLGGTEMNRKYHPVQYVRLQNKE